MSVQTPNNFFAEDKFGPVTAEISGETTVAGLARLYQQSQQTAERLGDLTPSVRERAAKWVKRGFFAGLVASTIAVGVHEIRSTHDSVSGSSIPTGEQVEANPDAYVPHVMQPGETVSEIVEPYTDNGHRVTAGVDHAASQQPDGTIEAGDTVYLPATTVPEEER